ncbi:50S ribosomal protein L21e [Candidatus Woesearchaeota archaeon]|nr:50S ribosomal protein L21e [Candidatus Woesearchaeota archaeon]
MTKRIGTNRRKSRSILTLPKKEKGRVPVSRVVQRFKAGDKVILNAHPSFHGGLYHMRFHGKTGIVKSECGACCNVQIKDGKKTKILVVHPVHLRRT